MVFRPNFLCIWHGGMSIVHATLEKFYVLLNLIQLENDLCKTSDGSTVGVAWCVHKGVGKPQSSNEKAIDPILLLAPGLGGKIHRFYMMSMYWYARSRGFKVGFVLYRNSEGIPITSNKLLYTGSHEDIKTVVEYVHNKYVMDRGGTKRTRLYL